MEIFYRDRKLFINIEEKMNRFLINELKRRMSYIIDAYTIEDIVLNFLTNTYYSKELVEELINDCKDRYNGRITVK